VRYLRSAVIDRYDPKSFEPRWAGEWEHRALYAASDYPDAGRKRFVMEMFPYPSGDLHMGHVENYSIADAMARYWRMRGFEVMHPMGYDAFGLPAENAAIQRGIHPKEWTDSNIEQMRSSFKRLGLSYDWMREVISCEPNYYHWNQWIFLKFYERGLAYRKQAPVNWCPVDKTVLAREQLSKGVCWRCGSVPEIRDLAQWFLRITDYSDRLLDDMVLLDWSESILSQQRHWIGRSEGAEVTFKVRRADTSRGGGATPSEVGGATPREVPAQRERAGVAQQEASGGRAQAGSERVSGREESLDIPVFTTRPDTLWGATFFVFAPEHPLALSLVEGTELEEPFKNFVDDIRRETEVERLAAKGLRAGMALPAVAINPVNGEEISVWAADYVLMGYGTGAIMAVPAHDQRDFDFARQHGLEVRVVIQPEETELDGEAMTEAYAGPGVMVNSDRFDGTVVFPDSLEGITKVIQWLEEEGKGQRMVNYRLRDWLVSRQRYWGTPIPIIRCPVCGEVPVPYKDLPVLLPEEADYKPTGDVQGPLAAVTEWVNVKCPNCGGDAKRETDTLDTFFDSSWYFLRYCDPDNNQEPFSPEKVAGWCPVDQYVGGTEHAVMHLIYARFFIKVFQDMGLVDFPEPFLSLFNQGHVTFAGREMSKSKGHVVEASEVIDRFGADAARSFILFSSPPEADYDFPPDGLGEIGRVAFSWLSRVWRVLSTVGDEAPTPELERAVNRTIKAVTEDFESFGFNTAIARMMELVNELARLKGPVPRAAAEPLLKLLAPVAPFITEELWHRYGNRDSIHLEPWPSYDESLAAAEKVTMVVQVNGKVRDRIEVSPAISEEEMRMLALGSEKVRKYLDGREPDRIVTRRPNLVNLVI
jgi:leucyl-tRNA synthetase